MLGPRLTLRTIFLQESARDEVASIYLWTENPCNFLSKKRVREALGVS